MASLTPGQALVKIVHDELVALMGAANEDLNLAARPPAVILMAGLQGSGKTTTVAKLARFLQERKKKSVMVVSADVYRPAAIEQLRNWPPRSAWPSSRADPTRSRWTSRAAVEEARKRLMDVLIVDTAGRLHIDEAMMEEISAVHAAIKPVETLFVVDAMTGQDAANTAKAFDEALPLTGVILTKTDGDARGGAALSIRHHRQADQVHRCGREDRSARAVPPGACRLAHPRHGRRAQPDRAGEQDRRQGEGGGAGQEAEEGQGLRPRRLPRSAAADEKHGRPRRPDGQAAGHGRGQPDAGKAQLGDKQLKQLVAIINSMTPQERRFPEIISGSRKRRIAMGSGTQVQDVNRLLKQFEQMQKMMKRMGKGGLQRMLRDVKGRLPGLPG